MLDALARRYGKLPTEIEDADVRNLKILRIAEYGRPERDDAATFGATFGMDSGRG
jgi:hypothetical protein